MANTYTQLYIQIVFAVQGRERMISEKIRDSLEKYMCGIVTNNESKPLAIYCNPDHVHLLIGLHPSRSVSEMARDVKASSSKWINEKGLFAKKFRWQEGFGAFSYSRSQIDRVIKYILNHPEHHKRKSFKEEYLEMLKKADIEYDARFLFEWHE